MLPSRSSSSRRAKPEYFFCLFYNAWCCTYLNKPLLPSHDKVYFVLFFITVILTVLMDQISYIVSELHFQVFPTY